MEVPREESEQRQSSYWSAQEASVNGMLGGFGDLDQRDVEASRVFLDRVLPPRLREQQPALDCGAGIGRVTKHLLLPAGLRPVDLLDINQQFLDQAPAFVAAEPGALGQRYCSSLAAFDFDCAAGRRWRLIWVQWCVIYLADADFVGFFRRAAAALDGPEALIVLKENTLGRPSQPVIDEEDCSVTRSNLHMRRLFKEAGLEVVECEKQADFPNSLYSVYMFALKPAPAA